MDGAPAFSLTFAFHFGYGRTDLPGGSVHQLAESLRRLQPLAQQYEIYPGH